MIKLENKYIVIKRDKLAQAFIHCLILDKPWTDGNGLQFVDYPEMQDFLDEAMKFIGHDYFVMNLDEPASQAAMEKYFKYNDQDKECGCIPSKDIWCGEAITLYNNLRNLNHWSDAGTPEQKQALKEYNDHRNKAIENEDKVPKV